ncbi:hypothetical protein BP6252_06036 [Coleophoma cylindrospora]|uniref:Uncharacterized protein n=1 Tax=Coleophoma cylindrospora TaxID=1849047 RepID=A0A3D8RLX2_9HELO|nr:hypothetical protein BP6252_06036 [Coleophoma cylindrospora]
METSPACPDDRLHAKPELVFQAIINLVPAAPRFEPAFENSMRKTFTDCYYAPGFVGGGWAYALNSNDASGEVMGAVQNDASVVLSESDRRLAYYAIGWDTIELHHEYSKTPLFDEEINKLKPWYGPGTGAFYVSFERHS